MSWEPDSTLVEQLKHILAGTLSPDAQIRSEATSALEHASAEPYFCNYLLYILIADGSTPTQVKASAGVALKNNLIMNFSAKDNEYLLDNVLKGLLDDDRLVRNITGNVITTIFSKLGVRHWPSALPQLLELTEAGNINNQEGATSALSKICEDSADKLDIEYNGQRPLDFMVPKFIVLTTAQSPNIKSDALNSLNQIIQLRTQSFLVHIDDFLNRLFQLANDENPEVRRNVCKAFSCILETRPDKIAPHLDGVINYSLHTMTSNEPKVALEACEFLLSLATSDIPDNLIQPYLPSMLPILLKSMVYSEMDIMMLDDADDADEDDKDEDIKPTAAKSKLHGFAEAEDDEDDDSGFEWNLRKCSAATLDVLSSLLPGDVLQISLPLLKENLTSSEWPVREASILAFGAVAEGGIELAAGQLPALVPFLVECLKDQSPHVRQITCWTLSRYSSWICSEAHGGGSYSNYFEATFKSVIDCALDKKKVVQESASSAIAQFIETADSDLIQPFAAILLDTFSRCFQVYKRKNLIILYDAIQTFIEKIELDDASINVLLPPLIHKWGILSDDDKELWPLLECMSSVAVSLGERFAPYAVEVYQRATRILSRCIELDNQVIVDPSIQLPEKDFMITSIDLIDGLVQGLGAHSGDLLQDDVMRLLPQTFNDTSDDVRQSAFALLGDLAIFVPEKLTPVLDDIVMSIGKEIVSRDQNTAPVCSNATWALGEISLRHDLKKYLDGLVGVLIDLMNSQNPSIVLENCAITIGRIGKTAPEFFCMHLSEFSLKFSTYVMYLEENSEKTSALEGMCEIILLNPQGIPLESLRAFLECVALSTPSSSLMIAVKKVVDVYKVLLGPQIFDLFKQLSNANELKLKYKI